MTAHNQPQAYRTRSRRRCSVLARAQCPALGRTGYRTATAHQTPRKKSAQFKTLQLNLSQSLGCKTQVSGDENGGRIALAYGNREELEMLLPSWALPCRKVKKRANQKIKQPKKHRKKQVWANKQKPVGKPTGKYMLPAPTPWVAAKQGRRRIFRNALFSFYSLRRTAPNIPSSHGWSLGVRYCLYSCKPEWSRIRRSICFSFSCTRKVQVM